MRLLKVNAIFKPRNWKNVIFAKEDSIATIFSEYFKRQLI